MGGSTRRCSPCGGQGCSRVPVEALFANLEGGATVEQFCEWFPGVDQQVRQVLDQLRKSVTPLLLPDDQ